MSSPGRPSTVPSGSPPQSDEEMADTKERKREKRKEQEEEEKRERREKKNEKRKEKRSKMIKKWQESSDEEESEVYHSYSDIFCERPVLGTIPAIVSDWRHLLLEMIGTALLVFFGTGAAISSISLQGLTAASIVSTATAFGFVVATVVYAIGNISGGHINPAVTMGMIVTMKIPLLKGLFYIGFQTVGAIIGSALVYGVFPFNVASYMNYGANSVNIEGVWTRDRGFTYSNYTVNTGEAFLLEATFGFTLVLVVLMTVRVPKSPPSHDRNGFAPLAIGLAVFVSHLVGIPLTGTSMNPARSLGPAIFSGFWNNHWIWWIAPMTGAALAGIVYKYVITQPVPTKK